MIGSVNLMPLSDYAMQLLVTKQMQDPMHKINKIVSHKLKGSIRPKYMLYSAHDDNIA